MSVTRGRYSFHSHTGRLAQITNYGVTAWRKESRVYLDRAVLIGAQPLEDGKMFEVVIEEKVTRRLGLVRRSIAIGCTTFTPEAVPLPNSLSSFSQDSWIMLGSALVKHGRRQIKNYGQDLNSLDVGDTVGIVRIGRQLKFYVNGTDQGIAEDNLPPVVYPMMDLYGKCTQISILSPEPLRGGAGAVVEAPLLFHKNCGKNIKISSNGQRARKQDAGNMDCIVISNRPLRDSELFEVRITGMNDQPLVHWSIWVGITTLQPDTMELPDTLFNIQSKTWCMRGHDILLNQEYLTSNYGINLNSLKVGDRVGVMCTESREFLVIINGSDMGPAVSNLPSNVFGIIDIRGRCIEVELVHDSSISPRAEPATPTLVSRDHDICFSHIHGANAIISDDRKTVERCTPYEEWNCASVFSNRPLNRNELFEVSIDKLIDKLFGLSLQLGVIGIDPVKLDLNGLKLVINASKNNVPVWMLTGFKLARDNNYKEWKDYGLNLESLPEGSKVGLMVNDIGELHYYLNGQDKGCAFTGIPEGVYVAADVYVKCAEISICHSGSWEIMLAKLEQAKANNEVIKVSYTTVLFTGSSGVGKTTLLKKLNKEDLNRHHHSTGVAESTHKVCIKTTAVVKTIEGLQWTDLDYDSMIQYLNKHLQDLRFPPSRVTAATLPLEEKIPSSLDAEIDDQQSIPESLTSASSVTENVSFTSAASEPVSKKKVAKAELAAVDIAKANSSNTPLLGEVWDIVNFLDTGGQPEFVNILPVVSSSIALTFIVFNLSKSLSDLVYVQHNVKGDPSFEPYHLDCSNLEFIKRLMVSTENFNKNVSSSLQLKSVQRKDKGNDSKICYMGTHALDIKEEKIEEIDEQLSSIASELGLHQRSFWASPEPRLKRLFPVDMFPTDKDKESFEEIIKVVRENIQSQVQERDYYDVPIGWFIFLLNLQKLCKMNEISYVSYNEAVDVWIGENVNLKAKSHQSSQEDQVSREETEVHNILLFFHFMGMLFYYHKVEGIREFVFIDRQWLFEKLTELVEIKFTKDFNKKIISAEIIDKFTMEGRLNIDIIENLQINLQGIQPLYFIHLLDHLNIVAPVDSKMEEYFMPCVLPSFSENVSNLDKCYGTIKFIPLLVGFKNGPMPHGFFCQIVVEMLRNLPTGWLSPLLSTSRMQHVYNNLITFPTASGHAVSFFYKIGYLEIQVRHEDTQPAIIHCDVRYELDKVIRKVSNHLQLNEEQLCYGFYCSCENIKHFAKLEKLTPVSKYLSCGYGCIKITEEYEVWLQAARNPKQLLSGNWHPEATKKVYQNFRLKLITSLPMDDVIFLGLLRKENLFAGNLQEQVQAKSTNTERAAWFLDKAVEPSLCIDTIEPFCKLLEVMSDNEYLKSDFLSGLAKEMQQQLDKETLLISMKNHRADTDDSVTKDDSPHPAVTGEGSKAITR